jgi:creatinine amidohydrolase/Fe(II)-dependent formamide hydrolase-like protein
MLKHVLMVTGIAFLSANGLAQTPDTVFLEELTWTEVRDAIDAGTTTIIVPTAGTEQNGPHVVLGKHKYRMNAGSERIARELGNALVAPVVTFVPEGDIDPPTGHMRFAGTISIPEDIFKGILEYTARSLRAHGFTDILFVGDSGGNQRGMKEVSELLSKEWENDKARVHFISAWYTSRAFEDWLREQGEPDEVIGSHAGLSDTTTLMAVAPQHVRTELLTETVSWDIDGVSGDPSGSTIELGNIGMDFLVEAAMIQVRELLAEAE